MIAAGVLTQTATDGMFYYDNLPLNAKLKADAEGYAEYEAETGVATHLDVKLRPNTISGRVTDKQTGSAARQRSCAARLADSGEPLLRPLPSRTERTSDTQQARSHRQYPQPIRWGMASVLAAPLTDTIAM